MKYGKRLREEIERTFPEWKGQFISYKKLKKQLKLINPRSKANNIIYRRWPRFATRRFLQVNNMRLIIGFTRLLDNELKKVNTFYVDKEEDYIIRLKELQIRAANLEDDEEEIKLKVQKDILNFHGEMVLLLNYSVLNFTGLIKIVKKHNKRTGKKFEFTSMPKAKAMQQPFFSTDLLYKLMKECEAMLGPLFLPREDAPL
ncbi:SPX domain-containing protein 1-like [Euphorbia lathyris]|uniref:SPX domain-containing protein 1-like n=1 Tax=Euphorbia lathyris TaxID=212925 RepID=UPI0033133EFB